VQYFNLSDSVYKRRDHCIVIIYTIYVFDVNRNAGKVFATFDVAEGLRADTPSINRWIATQTASDACTDSHQALLIQ